MNSEDFKTLHRQGWVLTQTEGKQEMLNLALALGIPRPSRRGGSLIDELIPTPTTRAHPKSLSAQYGIGMFPLHTDTAHWRIPARYLILRAAQVVDNGRPTLLLEKSALRFTTADRSLFRRAVFAVRNGRNSFLATILPENEEFLRYDRDCMFPRTPSAALASRSLQELLKNCAIIEIRWYENQTLIVDNWRCLHGRASLNDEGQEVRILQRILVSSSNN